MVVGLNSFIEKNIPEARNMIAIDQKIDKWKCDNYDAPPIILIDLASFYRGMCDSSQGQLDVLFGSHKRSIKKTELVLERFHNMGVKLEFFCCGSARYIKNFDIIRKRKLENRKVVQSILQMIDLELSSDYIVQQLKSPIYNSGSYFVSIIMLAAKYGRIHKSHHNECKRDISIYAKRHNAMAVISGDTDFILINGQWSFWDVHHFDMITFKIMEIDKIKLRDFLELNNDELALLGTLTSKYFHPNLVNKFIRSLGNITNSFKNIANFIIRNFRNKQISPNIIAQMLSSVDVPKNRKIAEESLNLFANITDQEPVVEDELTCVIKRRYNSHVYEFLYGLPICIQPLFLCETMYRKYMVIALDILKREMGIVLQHKNTDNKQIVICFEESMNKTVCPVYPTMDVPPLLSLYQESKDEALSVIKLKLLCWIVSNELAFTTIQNIPNQYLCAVLALVNLVMNQLITRDEADCILYCLHQCNTNANLLNSLTYPKLIGKRPFQLVFLYDTFYQYMIFAMNTVGLSDLLTYNNLDGIYFHHNYEKFINMSKDEQNNLFKSIKDYRIYY